MPYWTSQPWFNDLLRMCTAAYFLPKRELFLSLNAVPGKPYVKPEWVFIVGFINLPILNIPSLT